MDLAQQLPGCCMRPDGLMRGKRVAVLGGAGGIGRAIVDRLLSEGAAVVVVDLPASLDRHPPPGIAIPVDLRDAASVAAAAATLATHLPALDGCVNCSGYTAPIAAVLDTDDAVFADIIDGNLLGAVRWAKAVVPLLRRGDAPSLVHLSSGLGQFIRPGYAPYAAAKAGINTLTKTLALECAPILRVNAVAPGAVNTAFLTGGTGRSAESAARLDTSAYASALPLQRIAETSDVVGPVMFLLGPDSAYMTGQVLWVNGGGYMP